MNEPGADLMATSGDASSESADETLLCRALSLYVALLLAILTVFAILALVKMAHVLLLLFISVLFAAALAGPTARMERLKIPRSVSAVLIYLATLGAVTMLGWFIIPPLIGQFTALIDQGPEHVERYDQLRERYEDLRQDVPALKPFDEQFSEASERVVNAIGDGLFDLPLRLFALFLDALAVFFVSILILTNRERLLAVVLSVTHPNNRDRTEDVLRKIWRRVGLYLRAKAIVMAIVATITYLVLMLIGVPFALLLAILVGLGQLVPRVGPWIARIPLLGIAAIEGWTTLLLVFVSSVVIENLKGYVISPFVEGDQLDIHPLLVFVSVLVGGALLGPAGAFIAVPAAAIVQVLFEEVILPWRVAQFTSEEPSP
ncbi:MAG TPA: AI-2E family transporter [Thermomicrobiales bacterium]|nr:AI-2E family transporter [Thermomicrobiales bacterium]